LRIIFAGTPQNAASTLDYLIENGVEVVGVLTKQDAPFGRSRQLTQSAVADVAAARGVPLYKTNRIDDETRTWIASLKADLGVIVAYGSILKKEDLEIPRLGWMNLHFSLLPQLPGPAPVQHALMSGLETTGVTIFILDEGIDSGPIVASTELKIGVNQNARELLEALTHAGNELLVEVLRDAENQISSAKAQSAAAPFAVAVKPTRAMARIDFSKSASEVHNLVRAMNPEPTAWFDYNEEPVRVLESELDTVVLPAGTAEIKDKKLVVGCKEGSVAFVKVQPSGKRPMSGADWFRGLRVEKLQLQ